MGKTWACARTYKERYDDMGIAARILEYSRRAERVELDVVDVCCSTGAAMNWCKSLLAEKGGITLRATGIDMSHGVAEEAEANLDRFVLLDLLEYGGSLDGTADVVVCANALRFVPGSTRGAVTVACARILKPGGVFITDAKGYRGSADMMGLKSLDDKKYPRMDEGKPRSLHDPHRFYRGVKSMSKSDASEYAKRIHSGWDEMGRIRRTLERTFIATGGFLKPFA